MLVLVLAASCAYRQPAAIVPPPPPQVPELASTGESKPLSEGSLFSGGGVYIFEDHRARRVGDLVTIKIVENYQSSQQVANKGSRSTGLKAGIARLLGFEKYVEQHNPRFSSSQMFDSSYQYNLNAQSQQSRKTDIKATITARVVKVLPNGNLVVQAKRVVKQDADLEYIVLTGIVRPQDIDADNSVLSTQLSDVTLEYSGRGPNKEIVRGPGWVAQILHWIWLF
ncbi:flagellar basal body L-ring protein FlgH [Thermosulfurimonas sp. F29]|uniref:flagellar basal body L-ring protein FlgH n=1 Tax=Thermosulfurimonas sp. F29 TaxID=2867247 RepID=UPI001C829226|nr:flagellar basal body L-ring protein FlgH [Thermosulfurimonas sp. F29]MBX6422755.1 flagellar basal body L-ring protein FlgH [Thermosulfurimonas sp. F29]